MRIPMINKWLLKLITLFCLVFALAPSFATAEKQTAAKQMAESSAEITTSISLDEAIKLARQKVKSEPVSVKAQVALGNLLLQKGSIEEAGTVFDNALSINERFHDALTGKGIVLARMGRDQEAEEMLQRALILNPNPVRTHYELGILYEKRGDFAKAVTEFKKGIEKYKEGRK